MFRWQCVPTLSAGTLPLCGILQAREKLLSLDTMEELHTYLVNFDALGSIQKVNELAKQAVLLFKKHSPSSMRHTILFKHSCIIDAQLVGDRWWVPETPARPDVSTLVRHRLVASAGWSRLVAPAVVATGAAVAIALMSGPGNNG
jgi:hypothetical protein